MEQPEKRKSPKDDSLDLEARARVTFAATAEDTEESEDSSKNEEENLSNEGLQKYLDEVMNEVKKAKTILHISIKKTKLKPNDTIKSHKYSYCECYTFIFGHVYSKTMGVYELSPFLVYLLAKECNIQISYRWY